VPGCACLDFRPRPISTTTVGSYNESNVREGGLSRGWSWAAQSESLSSLSSDRDTVCNSSLGDCGWSGSSQRSSKLSSRGALFVNTPVSLYTKWNARKGMNFYVAEGSGDHECRQDYEPHGYPKSQRAATVPEVWSLIIHPACGGANVRVVPASAAYLQPRIVHLPHQGQVEII
jgi:hypothetical protein